METDISTHKQCDYQTTSTSSQILGSEQLLYTLTLKLELELLCRGGGLNGFAVA